MTKVKIVKYGGSVFVRIPAQILELYKFKVGDELELEPLPDFKGFHLVKP